MTGSVGVTPYSWLRMKRASPRTPSESECRTRNCQPEPASYQHLNNRSAAGAERHAHPDFPSVFSYHLRQNTVDADARQQYRQTGKKKQQPHRQPPVTDRCSYQLLHRPYSRDGLIRIDLPHRLADGRDYARQDRLRSGRPGSVTFRLTADRGNRPVPLPPHPASRASCASRPRSRCTNWLWDLRGRHP